MRLLILITALLLLPLAPASAGTADDPDIVGDCGQTWWPGVAPTLPSNDVCAAWFDAVLDEGSGQVTSMSATVQTLEPTIPDMRVVQIGWTDGSCEVTLVFDDAVASAQRIEYGDGGAVFPQAYRGGSMEVRCGKVTETCLAVVNCTTYGFQQTMPLAEDAVQVRGDLITFLVDFTDEVLVDHAPAEGAVLTDLVARAQTAASRWVSPGFRISGFLTNPAHGAAWGERYQVPSRN